MVGWSSSAIASTIVALSMVVSTVGVTVAALWVRPIVMSMTVKLGSETADATLVGGVVSVKIVGAEASVLGLSLVIGAGVGIVGRELGVVDMLPVVGVGARLSASAGVVRGWGCVVR